MTTIQMKLQYVPPYQPKILFHPRKLVSSMYLALFYAYEIGFAVISLYLNFHIGT